MNNLKRYLKGLFENIVSSVLVSLLFSSGLTAALTILDYIPYSIGTCSDISYLEFLKGIPLLMLIFILVIFVPISIVMYSAEFFNVKIPTIKMSDTWSDRHDRFGKKANQFFTSKLFIVILFLFLLFSCGMYIYDAYNCRGMVGDPNIRPLF